MNIEQELARHGLSSLGDLDFEIHRLQQDERYHREMAGKIKKQKAEALARGEGMPRISWTSLWRTEDEQKLEYLLRLQQAIATAQRPPEPEPVDMRFVALFWVCVVGALFLVYYFLFR